MKNQIKLMILADDFTGALDTGVQFAKFGSPPHVTSDRWFDFDTVTPSTEVVVIDTATRPLHPGQVAEIIRDIVTRAKKVGIRHIYKKTDSALRGNIGSELAALLSCSDGKLLPFFPAYPKLGRTTANGIQYIDGVPVSESVFGRDPFEPVAHSFIPSIIAQQSPVKVSLVGEGDPFPAPGEEPEIAVFDTSGSDGFQRRAAQMKDALQHIDVMAGCAGFAEHLPWLLGLRRRVQKPQFGGKGLLVVSGSLNPITMRQLEVAKAAGFGHLTLTPRQKFDALADPVQRDALTRLIREQAQKTANFIIETSMLDSPPGGGAHPQESAAQRMTVSRNMGALVAQLVREGLDRTLVITGGDTLRGFMDSIGRSDIMPVCEIEGGVVLSRIELEGRLLPIVSKSGGFGATDVFLKVADYISSNSMEFVG